MLAPHSPLVAYRLDTARISPDDIGEERSYDAVIGDDELGRWLEVSLQLDCAARARGAQREAILTEFLAAEGVRWMPLAGLPYRLLEAAVRRHATRMEDWAFLQLAYTTLAAVSAVLPDEFVLERGRIIAQRARVARQLGASESAAVYYHEVEQLAAAGGLEELTARAWVGQGLLAQLVGNYPEASARYSCVLQLSADLSEPRTLAHQGLMMCAAVREDFDDAALHAWQAYQCAANDAQKVDMLVNLAQLMLDAGHPQAALHGFASALGRRPHPRAALPAFGGAALAAVAARGGSGARAAVRFTAARVDELVQTMGIGANPMLPFQSASALVETSEALALVGEPNWSRRAAAHAAAIADANGFHYLTHRLQRPRPLVASVPATPARLPIIQQVELLDGAELVGV